MFQVKDYSVFLVSLWFRVGKDGAQRSQETRIPVLMGSVIPQWSGIFRDLWGLRSELEVIC